MTKNSKNVLTNRRRRTKRQETTNSFDNRMSSSGKQTNYLYPSSVLVCLCFPEVDSLLSKVFVVSCLFIRHRLLVSTFS